MITLAEMAVRANTPLEAKVIKMYEKNSVILPYLPFKNIQGTSLDRKIEKVPGGVSTRSPNEDWGTAAGTTSEQERINEALKLLGGYASIDRFHIETGGKEADVLAEEIESKVEAMARMFDRLLLKGDSSVDDEEFNGLQTRVSTTQTLWTSEAAGGSALTLDLVDEGMDEVLGGADLLVMNAFCRRKLNKLARGSNQAIEQIGERFGRPIYAYAGIPIAVTGVDEVWNPILAFDEVDYAGDAAACSSMYLVRFGKDQLHGIQSGPIIVDDQGWRGNNREVYFNWFVSAMMPHPKSVVRIAGITSE